MTNSNPNAQPLTGWRRYFHPRVFPMLTLGFSAGLPYLLVFGTLSLWLGEAGTERAAVTMFSWALLGYSFKFVWAPLVDKLPLPGLTGRLGQRRGWLLFAQLCVVASMIAMAALNPVTEQALQMMAIASVLLGFSGATQDIVIDAYRIEAVDTDYQTMMAAAYIAGYRLGWFVAGAGALYIAEGLGTTKENYQYSAWAWAYLSMAGAMLVGIVTTLLVQEPVKRRESGLAHSASDYLRFVGVFLVFVSSFLALYLALNSPLANFRLIVGLDSHAGAVLIGAMRLSLSLVGAFGLAWLSVRLGLARRRMVYDTYVAPIADFFDRYGRPAILILLLIGFYRISDLVLGAIANLFYQDMNFSKTEIATVTKTFGIPMTILGGFLGGALAIRFGVMRILMLGAVMTVLTNLLFVWQAQNPADVAVLFVVIGADNITAGLASAAFIAFLSSLTSLSFTAMQYAIFSSLMTFFPSLLKGYTGAVVDVVGYENFFLGASLIGIPVFLLVWLVGRYVGSTNSSHDLVEK